MCGLTVSTAIAQLWEMGLCNRLLANKTTDRPFSADEIRGGILAQHLTMEDYQAPLEVSSAFLKNNNLF